MRIEGVNLLTILCMAAATYSTRAAGLWLMGRVQPTPLQEAWLRHVPGAVLVAIIAPQVVQAGPAGLVAVLATVLVAHRTSSLLLAMLAGVLTVWLLRQL